MNGLDENDVDHIGDEAWERIVRALLGSDRTEVLSRQAEEIFVGAGSGTRVFRVTGSAVTGSSQPVNWTVVVKFFSLDHRSFQSASTDPMSWDYWKREWLIYRSEWQQQLPGPLIAPRCLASGELTLEGAHRELAWIAMEDLAGGHHLAWSERRFHQVARHLGIFNGRYLSGQPLPHEPWLSRDWLRGWTEQAEQLIQLLPVAGSHPVAGQIFTTDVIEDLCQLWDQRHKLYAALDQLPQTLCHNDVFPRNLFVRGGAQLQTVAIDWANCGHAPIGQELSPLVGATQAFLESRPERWDDVERECLDGYTEGLREAGWVGGEEVLTGYLLSTVLRFGVGALPPVLGLTLTTDHLELVGQIFGCSYDTFIANVAAALRFQQRRIHQATALLGL